MHTSSRPATSPASQLTLLFTGIVLMMGWALVLTAANLISWVCVIAVGLAMIVASWKVALPHEYRIIRLALGALGAVTVFAGVFFAFP